MNSPPGVYRIPYYAREWEKPEAPRKWRPETTITADILEVEPDLIKDIELQSIVSDYLRRKPLDNDEVDDPIAKAAEEFKQSKKEQNEGVKIGTTSSKSDKEKSTVQPKNRNSSKSEKPRK